VSTGQNNFGGQAVFSVSTDDANEESWITYPHIYPTDLTLGIPSLPSHSHTFGGPTTGTVGNKQFDPNWFRNVIINECKRVNALSKEEQMKEILDGKDIFDYIFDPHEDVIDVYKYKTKL
jgi:hypothetical protein